ncbi:MAG: family 16 glycoside hydrolase [Terriglobia bacterium]
MNRPRPPIVKPGAPKLPVLPPSDAVILFDGADLSKWRSEDGSPAKWIVVNGYMESVKGSGYLYTRQNFGDIQLHVEWATPVPPAGNSQGRGNSGVFPMGLYEIQVLDSYQNDTYPDGQAGAVYGQYPPLVNACLPPGEWQSYDIVFRRPRFDLVGQLLEPARVTVIQNGVLVQDNVKIWGPTQWLQYLPYTPQPDRLPLSLQDHGNPVHYRNIWLRELPEFTEPGPSNPMMEPTLTLQPSEQNRYVGKYRSPNGDICTIFRESGQLWASFYAPVKVELVPHSPSRFSLRWTAATLTFDLDANSLPKGFTIDIGGEQRYSKEIRLNTTWQSKGTFAGGTERQA